MIGSLIQSLNQASTMMSILRISHLIFALGLKYYLLIFIHKKYYFLSTSPKISSMLFLSKGIIKFGGIISYKNKIMSIHISAR